MHEKRPLRPEKTFVLIGAIGGARASLERPNLESGRGSRPRLPRYRGLDADGAARPGTAARAARGRQAARRLRRGDAAPAAALVCPPARAPGRLRHALSRRARAPAAPGVQDLPASRPRATAPRGLARGTRRPA